MRTPLISRACFRKHSCLVEKKICATNQRVYSRIYSCICVFIIAILVLLHCSTLDSSSIYAPNPTSDSSISRKPTLIRPKTLTNHPLNGQNPSFSSLINGKTPPYHPLQGKKPSFSSSINGKTPSFDPIYGHNPSFSSSIQGETPSVHSIHAQSHSDPSSSIHGQNPSFSEEFSPAIAAGPALHGLGTVFIRGTIAMDELVVAHVAEDTSVQDFRLFLRTFHRSGMTARADLVLLFASINGLPVAMVEAINEENTFLRKLLSQNRRRLASLDQSVGNLPRNHDNLHSNSTISPFNYNSFGKADPCHEPIWGLNFDNHHDKCNNSHTNTEFDDGLVQFGLGSIVGFDVSELNPDDNLQGFIDNPPLQLRRWACYQMLLGMVRHKFKQILLSGVSGVFVLGDPLAMARRKVGLYLSLEDRSWGSSSVIKDDLGVKFGLSEEIDEAKMGKFHAVGGLDDAKKGRFHGVGGLDDAKMRSFHGVRGLDDTKMGSLHSFGGLDDAGKERVHGVGGGLDNAKMGGFHADEGLDDAKLGNFQADEVPAGVFHADESLHGANLRVFDANEGFNDAKTSRPHADKGLGTGKISNSHTDESSDDETKLDNSHDKHMAMASLSQHADQNSIGFRWQLNAQEEKTSTTHADESLDDAKSTDSHTIYMASLQQADEQYGIGIRQQLHAQRKGYMHRRGGRRRKGKKAGGGGGGGLYERVYGRMVWSTLDDVDKNKRLANAAAIAGAIAHIRSLANIMVTEIVKVALERKSREAFPDNVLLSHLVHKSSGVLGKKVLEHLHPLGNAESSFVHSLIGSQQPSLFSKEKSRQAYPMVSGGNAKSRLWRSVVDLIHQDVCSSSADAAVYNDCSHFPF